MKHQSRGSFDKHLLSGHLSRVYLIVASCGFERRKIAEKIAAAVQGSSFHALEAEGTELTAVVDPLNTRSLFGDTVVLFVDGMEKTKELSGLTSYVVNPSPFAFLILGSTQMKPLADLYQKGKKEVVVLDLSEEKPWERQRWLSEWLIEEAKREKKVLAPDAAALLLEQVSSEMPGLQQELQKLVCYIGERNLITLADVRAISVTRSLATGWQLAEGVVWGKEGTPTSAIGDLAFFLPFIGQIRYHLQTGGQIAAILEKNGRPAEYFPQLRPQVLDKYVAGARQKKSGYFMKGLNALYEMEVLAKSSQLEPGFLFDLFLGKLRQ